MKTPPPFGIRLRRCPFCGSVARFRWFTVWTPKPDEHLIDGSFVQCSNSTCMTEVGNNWGNTYGKSCGLHKTIRKAAEAWNRRVKPKRTKRPCRNSPKTT